MLQIGLKPSEQGAIMTKEEIIRMAQEADEHADLVTAENALLNWYEVRDERFAELVRKDYSTTHANLWLDRIHKFVLEEREACIKIVEDEAMQYAEPVWAFEIVNDIKARGQA